jgi:hypothetical protein
MTSMWQYTVLGGGRIEHDSEKGRILRTMSTAMILVWFVPGHVLVYGHSYGFPWKDEPMHNVSAELIRTAYPGYNVEWNDEGY